MARKRPASSTTDGEFWFDAGAAELAVDFFRECLVHTKGELAGQPLRLAPWQAEQIIRPLFGWKRADGTRRYREAYIEVPKKNGKSTLAAGIALYMLFADGEIGAEVYSCAGDKDQARIVFNDAKLMRAMSPELRKRSRAYKDAIAVLPTASKYQVLSSDAPTKHGLNPHAILFDELHVQPNRELWDTVTTGVAARRQPLIVAITTAGYDRASLCWEKHDYALKVRDGSIADPHFLAVIYAASEQDDWRDPATWAKANPNYGLSVKPEYFLGQIKKAEDSLAYLNTFKRLHLNLWTESLTRWLPPDGWQACGGLVDADALAGRPCYAGLDLSTTTDLTAFALLFPPAAGEALWSLLTYFWCPEAMIRRRSQRDRVPYDVWAREGFLRSTPGDVVDYDIVRSDIRALGTRYRIHEIAYDRWNASQLVTQLQEDGARLTPFGQGFASMSAPTKDFEKLIVGQKLRHGDQPVLRWMAANVVLAKDAADNWKPTKAKSTGRIDGVVASIMALGCALRQGGPSIYERRGVVVW
jgi:phage terminase large subunit-like protein